MSQTQSEEADWKVLLGQLILAKQLIHQYDPDKVEEYTLPREKASEADIAAFEARVGERISPQYRDFLLHANGWPKVYFNVGLFGIPEFNGEGDWHTASELLDIYHSEGTLADSDLDIAGVMPIAAGQGMRHLIVIVRPGWPDEGTVVWFDGGEVFRADSFVEFFEALIATDEAEAEAFASGGDDA